MSRDVGIAAAILAPVVLGALFSLGRLAAEGNDVPAEEAYRDAHAAILRGGFDASARDVIAVLPAWSLRPLKVMGDLPRITGDDLDARPLDRWRRLFVVLEADGEATFDRLVVARGEPSEVFRDGALSVWRFDLGGPHLAFDFAASLSSAKARLVDARGAEVAACDGPLANGFSCQGRKSWQRLSLEQLLVTENGDFAVWAHPPAPPERLEITYDDVPLGRAIVLRAGFTRGGADNAKAPVEIDVAVDGERVAHESFVPVFDFSTRWISTTALAGRRGRVTFSISTSDNSGSHFAFDAFASSAETAGGVTP